MPRDYLLEIRRIDGPLDTKDGEETFSLCTRPHNVYAVKSLDGSALWGIESDIMKALQSSPKDGELTVRA